MPDAKTVLPDITYAQDVYDALRGADAVVLSTEWNQFRNLDLERVKGLLRKPIFIDLRNVYEPAKVRQSGFLYIGVGRGEET